MSEDIKENEPKGERIAKRIARAGLCSRRDAEIWITDRRVKVNGKTLETPACVVTDADEILVDGAPTKKIVSTTHFSSLVPGQWRRSIFADLSFIDVRYFLFLAVVSGKV